MASVIGSLILTLIVISVLKEQHIGRIEGRLLKEKQWVVKKAHHRIRKDLNQSFRELHQRAKDIAEDEKIVEALQLFTSNADPASQQQLIQRFSEYKVDEQRSVELYTVAPRLVAWNGFSMPLGEAPLTSQFSNSIQYESIEGQGCLECAGRLASCKL